MAESVQKIRYEVEAGAARAEVESLGASTRGLTKAAEAAGEETINLHKRTAQLAAQQRAAREETERARRAHAEAAAAVQAHGKDSHQAAAAIARATAATESAAKASRDLAAAEEQTRRAVERAAAAADDKAAPGLKRLAAQLDRTARESEKTGSDIRILESRMVGLGRAAGQIEAPARAGGLGLSSLGSLATKAAGALGVGMLAGAALEAGEAIRGAAMEVLSFETAVGNIPFGLGKARTATKGLVSDMQLAQSAAQGVALGVVTTEEEYAALAEAATKLGIKLKIGPSQALDNMMTALGRGSSEILDNLGVTMKASEAYDRYAAALGTTADKLTDAQKKAAFKTEAIKALTVAAAGTTIETDSAAAAIERFGVRMDNAKTVAKSLAVEGVGAVLSAIESMGDAAVVSEEEVATLVAYSDKMRAAENATRAQTKAQQEYLAVLGKSVNLSADELAAYEAVGKAAFDNANTLGTLGTDMARGLALVQEYTGGLLEQAKAHMAVAAGVDAQSLAEAKLWDELAKRNAKLEDKAIEDAFFKAAEMGPAPAPGFVRKEDRPKARKGKAKDPAMEAIKGFSFGGDESFGNADPLGAMWDEDAAAAYEGENAAREARVTGIERELAALEARGIAEAENVDAVFFSLEVESEAAAQRERMIDRRLEAEMKLAAWQRDNARTDEQRARAQTRLETVEHQKRLRVLQKSAADEAKVLAQREKAVDAVVSTVTTLGNGLVDALQKAADGEKGAVAAMTAELLKGLAVQHGLLALAELAKAAGAAASYNYPKAAAHGVAAGMHGAVAIAAGAGAAVAGAVAESRQGGGGSGPSPFGTAGGGPRGGGASGPRGGGGSGVEDVEQLEVPISSEQMRRGDPRLRLDDDGRGQSITINVQGSVVTERELADVVTRHQARAARQGRKPRI